nr:MAG TPA: hypothetical protein [Caudoviricetes sp.]
MPLSKRNLLFYLETTAKKCILGLSPYQGTLFNYLYSKHIKNKFYFPYNIITRTRGS